MFNDQNFAFRKLYVDEQQFKLLFAFRKQLETHFNVQIYFCDSLKWNVLLYPSVSGHNDNIKKVEKFIFKEENHPFRGTNNKLEKNPVTLVSSTTSDNASENTFQDNKRKCQQYFKGTFKKIKNKLKQRSRFSEKCEEYVFHNKNKTDSLTDELTECYLVSRRKNNSEDVTNKRKGVFQGRKWRWQLARESLKTIKQQATTSNTSDAEICEVYNKISVSKNILHNGNKSAAVTNSEVKKDYLSSQKIETSDVTSKRKNTFQLKMCKRRRLDKSTVNHKVSSNVSDDKECEASNKTSISNYIFHNKDKTGILPDELTECYLVSGSKKNSEDVTSKRKGIFQGNKWHWQLASDSLKKIEQQTKTEDTSDVEIICEVRNKIAISSCGKRFLQPKNSFSCTEKDLCEVIKSREQESLQSSNNSQMVLQSDDKENIGVTNVAIVRSLSVGPCLRPIVIDGKSVAKVHGRREGRRNEVISYKGIEISVQYFLERGHTQVMAFVPRYFEHSKRPSNARILQKLLKKQHLIYTPTRTVPGKFALSYNRGLILKRALMSGGVILSNDTFSDLKFSSRKTIQERLLKFSFAGDLLVIPKHPLGIKGPTLKEFLSFPVEDNSIARQQ